MPVVPHPESSRGSIMAAARIHAISFLLILLASFVELVKNLVLRDVIP
jgi:hypothetical protein